MVVTLPLGPQASTTASVMLSGARLAFIANAPAATISFPTATLNGRDVQMIVIGVDTHKRSHTLVALDAATGATRSADDRRERGGDA
jgi:hypothetical protein